MWIATVFNYDENSDSIGEQVAAFDNESDAQAFMKRCGSPNHIYIEEVPVNPVYETILFTFGFNLFKLFWTQNKKGVRKHGKIPNPCAFRLDVEHDQTEPKHEQEGFYWRCSVPAKTYEEALNAAHEIMRQQTFEIQVREGTQILKLINTVE